MAFSSINQREARRKSRRPTAATTKKKGQESELHPSPHLCGLTLSHKWVKKSFQSIYVHSLYILQVSQTGRRTYPTSACHSPSSNTHTMSLPCVRSFSYSTGATLHCHFTFLAPGSPATISHLSKRKTSVFVLGLCTGTVTTFLQRSSSSLLETL